MNRIFRPIWAAFLLGGLFITPVQPAEDDPALAKQVHAVFERSCAECHGPQLRKPKGKFGFVTDLDRLAAEEDYVLRGLPEQSEIYRLLVTSDEDEKMPPPESEAPKLTEGEINKVRLWILSLAAPASATPSSEATPAVASLSPTPAAAPNASPSPAASAAPRSLMTSIGHAHPSIVHFPIALLLTALLVEAIGLLQRRGGGGATSAWCLTLGTLGAIAGASTGWIDAGVEGYTEAAIQSHRLYGLIVAGCATVSSLSLWAAHRTGHRGLHWVSRLFLFLAAAAVALAGHTGGELVYGEGYFP